MLEMIFMLVRLTKDIAVVVVTILASVVLTPPAAAQTAAASSIDELRQRKRVLEHEVQKLESENISTNSIILRHLQEQLLEVTGDEDAALQQLPESPKGFNDQTSYIAVPVYYVTDRAKTDDRDFGSQLRSHGVEFGLSTVTLGLTYGVRPDLIAGARNLPQGSRTSPPAIKGMNDEKELIKAIAENKTDAQGRERRVLLFVHGYDVSFAGAMNAAAKLSTEVQFPVIPLAYTWPSDGSYIGYWHDEDVVRASYQRLSAFLETLLTKSPAEVVIVCHSMGAREVTSALVELIHRGMKTPALHKVVFAAGDISSQEFMEAWPELQKLNGVQFAFYASDHDLALRLSHIVHRLARLGDASPEIIAPPGGMTVDASAVDSVFQAAGHSYILNSPKLGADLGMWIDGEPTPTARGLTQIVRSGQSYYFFP